MNSQDPNELSRIINRVKSSLEEDEFWGLETMRSKNKIPEKTTPITKTPAARAVSTSLFESSAAIEPKPKLSREERIKELEKIADEVRSCTKCRLCETRTNAVPGEGNPEPRILFVGEGPGANEDEQGRPFVGRAGKLLTDIIEKGMKIPRSEVFIANIVKCRPPENREPAPDEIVACMPYLRRQIDVLSPEVTVPLGRPASFTLLETNASMSSLRGKIHMKEGRKFIPTFHPAYLLRNPPEKKKTWEDIQVVMRELGMPIP